jgi:hypothetical protein
MGMGLGRLGGAGGRWLGLGMFTELMGLGVVGQIEQVTSWCCAWAGRLVWCGRYAKHVPDEVHEYT